MSLRFPHTLRSGIVLAALAPLCLSACSATAQSGASLETAGPGWEADFEDLRQRAKGTKDEEVTLKIYEDNAISDAELSEAGARYQKCIQDAGFPDYSFDPFGFDFGIKNATPSEQDHFIQADEICNESTGFMWVRSMWASLRKNPSNVNWSELQAACMVKLGVVDSSFTGKDLDKAFNDFGHLSREGKISDNQEPNDLIPYIVTPAEGKAAEHRCNLEPQNVLGFSTATSSQ